MPFKRREKILLGVSVVLLASAWFLTSPPETPPAAAPSEAGGKGTVIASTEKMAITLDKLEKAPEISKADPFMPISAIPSTEEQKTTSASFTLQGIFSDTKGRAAILNGEIFYEGSNIVPGTLLQQVLNDEIIIQTATETLHVRFNP